MATSRLPVVHGVAHDPAMKVTHRAIPAALALGTLLVAALPAQAAHHPAHATSYGTKATYSPRQSAHSYQRPPAGFTPVFTENVSRHGSRAASDSEDGDLILTLWDKARTAGQLTGKGEEFGPGCAPSRPPWRRSATATSAGAASRRCGTPPRGCGSGCPRSSRRSPPTAKRSTSSAPGRAAPSTAPTRTPVSWPPPTRP